MKGKLKWEENPPAGRRPKPPSLSAIKKLSAQKDVESEERRKKK